MQGDLFESPDQTWSFHQDGTLPAVEDGKSIFVFGSNLAGRHGKGAALVAKASYGARIGQGEGAMGKSYAIPTKDEKLRTRSLGEMRDAVGRFIEYARAHPDLNFFVTRIGCVLAGYQDEQVAPMFRDAPLNCSFAHEWKRHL